MGHYHDVLSDLRGPARELRDAMPEAWAGFTALHKGAFADGVVPAHLKELVALAIAVTRQCDGCIAAHARAAAAKGATKQELAEVLGVTLLMNGGPGSVYGPRAWEAFAEFAPSTDGGPEAPAS